MDLPVIFLKEITMTIATAVEQAAYVVKLEIGIKECEGSRVLLQPKEYSTTITPPTFAFSSFQALKTRCENLALQEYAEQFRKDLTIDATLSRMLKGCDWTFFSRTKTFKRK